MNRSIGWINGLVSMCLGDGSMFLGEHGGSKEKLAGCPGKEKSKKPNLGSLSATR